MWHSPVSAARSDKEYHAEAGRSERPKGRPRGSRRTRLCGPWAPLTSSPTLTGTPPNAGRTTRSPSLSETGAIEPSLRGAPGPTARTVPSGGGACEAAEGRYRPEAVFCSWVVVGCVSATGVRRVERERERAHLDDLCALDEDAVEERGERLDRLDREGLAVVDEYSSRGEGEGEGGEETRRE